MPASKSQSENQWAMITHLSSLTGYLGVPIGFIIGPLLVWQIKKEEFPGLDRHGKNAVNFNLSVLIYSIVLGLSSVLIITLLITIPALIALVIAHIIITIKASLAARDGKKYDYPMSIQFFN